MTLDRKSLLRSRLSFALTLLLIVSAPIAWAQQAKKPPAPPPPPPPKAKPAPTPPKPAAPNDHHSDTGSAPEARAGGTTGSANLSHSTKTENAHATAPANASSSKMGWKNKPTAGNSGTTHAATASVVPVDPRAPSGLNLRTASTTGNTNKVTGAANLGSANTPAGTTRLANGGTRALHPDGSTVEKNRNGRVTGVTTSQGATAKMDAFGRPAAIRDGKGMAISRGPHSERRIETTRGDRSRLVSTGKQSGYLERHVIRGGHEIAQRSYYHNGRYYTRLYLPYSYLGRPYYGYIPAVYYDPLFYRWAYNPWQTPVTYAWGWYGEPWYAPYGYYFAPYASYQEPAFWLADFAMAQSLREAAEEADSGNPTEEGGSPYAVAGAGPETQDQGTPVTPVMKDQIGEQVKEIIADEQDATARGNAGSGSDTTPAVPPSIDPRFTLFIVSSEMGLDTQNAPCSVTSGDIVKRIEYTPDGNNTVAVQVVSSKRGDCPAGTTSRLDVDALEEMHDNLREKVDDGLKSLSENQGKGGIPIGPAANPKQVPDGVSDPDLTVGDELKKQEAAADGIEKDVQVASSDGGTGN